MNSSKLTCREKVFFCICLSRKTQPSSVEVIVDRAEGSVYSDKTSDSDPELDSSDWEYFHSLMLVRSVISSFLLNVWSSSSISARVGLREILRVILLARDLSLFFLDSLWMESLMLNNCFIRLISCVLISLWKKKIIEKYFYFNLLKNSCIKTQATSFSYIIRKLQNFETSLPTQSAVWQMQR